MFGSTYYMEYEVAASNFLGMMTSIMRHNWQRGESAVVFDSFAIYVNGCAHIFC